MPGTNLLEDADDELLAMASYYLGPDPTPVKVRTPPPQSQRIPPTSATQKKLKRNERDRQRSLAKRESLTHMRQQVTALEQRKHHLVERIGDGWGEGKSQHEQMASDSRYPSPVTPITRENFVRLSHEIEAFRRQNAGLTQQLRERDVTTGYMQNLLLEFSPDETDHETTSTSSESDSGYKPQPRKSVTSQSLPRPYSRDANVRFTPLTPEEGRTCVDSTLQLIRNAHALYANDAHYHNRSKFLGWWQYTRREGCSITFSVKKTLKNVTPAQLMATTWHLLTDGKRTQRLIPSSVHTHIRPLQKLSDDLIVIDRRSEDSARAGLVGEKLALRTIYVLFRVVHRDGTQTLAMKTINLPLVKQMLREDEMWCEIFYWIRISPEVTQHSSPIVADLPQEVATVIEFGGANTYTRDGIAEAWLQELVFLAIRWESVAVTPSLLQF